MTNPLTPERLEEALDWKIKKIKVERTFNESMLKRGNKVAEKSRDRGYFAKKYRVEDTELAALEFAQQMQWQPVKGYEGKYEVNPFGEVRKVEGGNLGQWIDSKGYPLVRLSEPRAVIPVHRIVAEAFIEKPEGKNTVNHIDFNRHNNCVRNLEWCTQAENVKHSRDAGRYPDDYWKGKRSPNAKLTDSDVEVIRSMYSSGYYSHQQLADVFNCSKRTVGRVVNNESYKLNERKLLHECTGDNK